MSGVMLWGWDKDAKKWRKMLVNADGKLIIDPSEILEDTPTDGEVGKAPTSNWAYDEAVARAAADALLLPLAGGTMTGDIDLGANKLKTTNLLLKEYATNYLVVRNLADNAYRNLAVAIVEVSTGFYAAANAIYLSARSVDNYYLRLLARDSGVGLVEVARLGGAADPYFAMGGAQEFKFLNSGAMGSDLPMGGNRVTGLADPTDEQDAATKASVKVTSKSLYATRDMTAASGDVSYTGVGFTPSCIVCLAAIAGGNAAIGFSDSSMGGLRISAVISAWYIGGQFIAIGSDIDNLQSAIVKSYDSDGFTLTWTKVLNPTGTVTLCFLCLK